MAPEVGNGEAESSSPLLFFFSHQRSTFIYGQISDSCVLWHAYLWELHEILEFIGSLSSHNLHGRQKSPAGKSFKWSSPKSQHVMGPFVRAERRGNLWICLTGDLMYWEEDIDRVTLGGVIDTRAASRFLPLDLLFIILHNLNGREWSSPFSRSPFSDARQPTMPRALRTIHYMS